MNRYEVVAEFRFQGDFSRISLVRSAANKRAVSRLVKSEAASLGSKETRIISITEIDAR